MQQGGPVRRRGSYQLSDINSVISKEAEKLKTEN
jgi:hypothetical protein